ncbi:hypothetical protein Taro_029568 [Colocasia esculenta]|uniref:Uncharacterized protein n=1 Tax=Colocasia esculenta TaxID=4460 RepID=A0A843VLQ5_COLES|nr:hypothetical protein [Colocasia esculenta]
MEGARQLQGWRRRPSWRCTLLTQACLCIALYAAFNIGSLRAPRSGEESGGHVTGGSRYQDLYFMSVGGGARPLQQQAQLLWQMENVARKYRAAFIVNLSELGDNDPLTYNASFNFPSLKVPWYAIPLLKEVHHSTAYCILWESMLSETLVS